MRDRVGGDTQLQAVLLLYGLDIWMEKKSSIQYTDVSNYPHVGWHGLPQPSFLGGMFSGCSESWGSSNGSDSFSVVSVKMSQSLGLETRHAFQVPSATLMGNPPKIWNTYAFSKPPRAGVPRRAQPIPGPHKALLTNAACGKCFHVKT